ncbi:hypothetical protein EHQ61_04840 [Leptospira wolffii]|uniref:hypothetical protein n=1 Tax=Leptospira wolffii TaxID=409998 RepID=UPI00108293B9|nr:hypothetical protein [Leptospira wolffii]TGL52402.1 hypothetical protein EHQ61_04840 [Leptospira wolffii]
MKFNELVKKILHPILDEYGFKLIKDSNYIVQFESAVLRVNVTFDEREKSNFIEIGNPDDIMLPLSDGAIRNVFHMNIQIDNAPSEIFLKNIALFFRQKSGIELLEGRVDGLRKYVFQESKAYTSKLIFEQELEKFSREWNNKKYQNAVEIAENIGVDRLPRGFFLKYKFAKKKSISS